MTSSHPKKRPANADAAAVAAQAAPADDALRKKRTAPADSAPAINVQDGDESEGMGEFEDEFGDEEDDDDEGEVIVDNDDDEDEDMMEEEEDEEAEEPEAKVYLPGQKLGEDEELVHDASAYEMLHQLQVEWPCLSLDFIRDDLGENRGGQFPMTLYVVAGSQAERPQDNKVYVMKMSELHRTKHDQTDDVSDSEDENDLDEDPVLEHKTLAHTHGGVNRIRVMPHASRHIAATWSDGGKVHIHDLTAHVTALDTPGAPAPPLHQKSLHIVSPHKTEGYALDWAPLGPSRLVSGDCNGRIFFTTATQSGFETRKDAFLGHSGSVEDLQWAPREETVFASCGTDGTVKIWDTRESARPQLSFKAHDVDVNVLSWNRLTDKLIATGSDSGAFSVWDLRQVINPSITPTPAATFSWHRDAITSIRWHPAESSVLAAVGADDQLTLWDLALERDEGERPVVTEDGLEVPPQLLFVHQGFENGKECAWHPHATGVIGLTAGSGFHMFKTINS